MECGGTDRLLDLSNITQTWILGPLLDSVQMKYKLYIRDCTTIWSVHILNMCQIILILL